MVKEITDNLSNGRAHRSDWRKEAREDFDFYAGVQWSAEDLQVLKDANRPTPVFNRIIRTINAVSGVELQNRQEVKYLPRNVDDTSTDPSQLPQLLGNQQLPEVGEALIPNPMAVNQQNPTNDVGFADMLNGAAKWVRDQNNAEDEESDAFEDCLICGEGWTETRMSYDEEPEGMIVKDRLDPLKIIVDPDARKRNYEDAKWVAYVKDFDPQEAARLFPDVVNPQTGAFWDDSDYVPVVNRDENYKYLEDQSDQLTKVNKVAIVQYQYYRREPIHLIPLGNKIIQLSQKKYDLAEPMIKRAGLKSVKVRKKVFYQCFLVGNRIAQKPEALGCDHFTLRSMTGLQDRIRNVFFGLVRLMKDPQRWANKWLSQIQHILNSNAKGGVMVEEDAVPNFREFEDNWAKAESVIKLRTGALGAGKIQPKEMAKYPDGIDRLLNYAIATINDVVGVNLEMMGMANRDQPIGLEMERKRAGITVLAKFFDALRRYRKMDGRILAYYIREYIADGRLVRIVGKSGAKYVPLLKDKLAFEYDIVVDDAPTSPNSKERTFGILQTIIPMAQQAGIPIPPEVLDYLPLPDSFIQAWKKTIEQSSQPDPLQEQIKQIALLEAQLGIQQDAANVEKTKSETIKNYAQAEKDKSVGEEQSALAMQKFGMLQGAQQLKEQNMMQDQHRKDLELILNQYRKMLEVQLDARLRGEALVRPRIPSLAELQ